MIYSSVKYFDNIQLQFVSGKLYIVILMIFFSVDLKSQNYLPRYQDTLMNVSLKNDIEAYAFPLQYIRLLDSPFLHAMENDGEWLLSLEPDRLLSRVREYAGLTPKGTVYGGWESQGISSHSLGHYLSALSMFYAASGDSEYLSRVNYILAELDTCQMAKATGYIGGIPNQDNVFSQVAAGILNVENFGLNGAWVPWYTVHKIFAGLMDAYIYTGNPLAKEILVRYADWVINTTKDLTKAQFQHMLGCEHGGMNEAMANVFAITGDVKYLTLSKRFNHDVVLNPLYNEQDNLSGLHANTQIPKIIGCARQYELTGIDSFQTISGFFWSAVAGHHSYANGGNSNFEHFGPPDRLNNETGASTTESCNTYNMLKLTGHLFAWTADARYADYYEKALYNHILASQNPETGMVCYFMPLSSGPQIKSYSTPFNDFWCCVGTGWENHAKYAENIYFHDSAGIYINLYIPSILTYEEKGMVIRQQTDYPDNDTINMELSLDQPKQLNLRFRCPWWAGQGMKIFVNGTEFIQSATAGTYAEVDRTWNDRDTVTLIIPMDVHLESMPDNPNRKAFFYGPVLLCNQLGNGELIAVRDVPVIVTDNDSAVTWTQKISDDSVHIKTDGVGELVEADLIPMFRMHNQQYAVYFDFFTNENWSLLKDSYIRTIDSLENMEAQTSDLVRIGEQQSEIDHNYLGVNSSSGEYNGRKWRHAIDGGWFSYRLAIKESKPLKLVCTYWGSDVYNRLFDVLVDDVVIATQRLENNRPGVFYDEIYPIPANLTDGKSVITIKFKAIPGMIAGGVFGLRLMYREEVSNFKETLKLNGQDVCVYYADNKLFVNNTKGDVHLMIFDGRGVLRLSKQIRSDCDIINIEFPQGFYIASVIDKDKLSAYKFVVY